MDWFIRFTLGLPARAKDAAALRKALPELGNENFRLQDRGYFRLLYLGFETNEELLKALRRWLDEVETQKDYRSAENLNCLLSNCPLLSDQSKINGDDEHDAIALFMVTAGGPRAKPPRDSFLDLVKRTHPKQDPPKDVILTDAYIYCDVSEDGRAGGFSNLVAYLEALGLSANDSFSLHMTPLPKRGGSTAKTKLHRDLKKKFKNIQLKDYSSKLKFHDRFYVVRHQSGEIKGVFGPSINGLTSDAIVLMGDINGLQPMKKLEDWFG